MYLCDFVYDTLFVVKIEGIVSHLECTFYAYLEHQIVGCLGSNHNGFFL